MSYTFGIWKLDDDLALNTDDLQEYFDRAWNEDHDSESIIIQLIANVTALFPEDEEYSVWDSLPLIDQAKGSTFYPGVRLSLGDNVLEAVVEHLILESGKLGLHVIDWQTEEIYAPEHFSLKENS